VWAIFYALHLLSTFEFVIVRFLMEMSCDWLEPRSFVVAPLQEKKHRSNSYFRIQILSTFVQLLKKEGHIIWF